ncbi:probable G-protein coupled receptor 139 [Mercenaria mercenaria]|uniref:probable G-protein coupled receptor 139 n=1 Tax=Mercenaria mercenaria TaxID=6596 RepID=UPI00234E9925|nr:probable G-protein coupled receptor 139 [Mercenaria mercenaria]
MFLESLETQLENQHLQHEIVLMELVEYRVHKVISLYIPPILLIMGTFGNMFSFLILRNKTMTRQSTNSFLSALALADSVVLFVGLLKNWIGEMSGLDIQNQADWLCKLTSLLIYSSSHFSVWLIIAVTIERYIAVSQPLHASRYCKLSRAKRVIALLAFVFILLNLHFIWTVTLNDRAIGKTVMHNCKATHHFVFFITTIWPWVDAALYALVPFLLIIVFNILIIIQTLRATTWRGEAQKGPLMNVEKRSNDNNIKLTVMLLCVSFTFLISTFPMSVAMVLHNQWEEEMHRPSTTVQLVAQRRLLRTIAEMLMYLNHSINFYLYCALGQKFRNQVIKTLCRRKISNTSNASDHSQHIYCSRVNGSHNHKSTCIDETIL